MRPLPADRSNDLADRLYETLAARARGTPVETVVKRFALVDRSQALLNRASGALLPNEVVFRLDGDTHRFHLSTLFEYRQFRKYDSPPDGPVLARFAADLSPDDVVWDVGANVGVYSVVAAATCGPTDVLAFEPHPSNADRIEENLALNGRAGAVHQLALSDESGSAELRVSSPDGTGAFALLDGDGSRHTIAVDTARGDDLVANEVPAPTVLKIDVQGAELSVLRGLAETLGECRVVYCNVYEKHLGTREREELHELLESSGLEVERISDWDAGCFLRASRDETSQ